MQSSISARAGLFFTWHQWQTFSHLLDVSSAIEKVIAWPPRPTLFLLSTDAGLHVRGIPKPHQDWQRAYRTGLNSCTCRSYAYVNIQVSEPPLQTAANISITPTLQMNQGLVKSMSHRAGHRPGTETGLGHKR